MSPSKDWTKFDILTEDDPTCITWASRGGDGSGKSYFACTAPAPIFVCASDPHGMARVDKAIRAGKEIKIGRYSFNHLRRAAAAGDMKREAIRDQALTIWKTFVDDYHTALKHVRTVIWDREDLFWELIRYANFGGEKNEGSKTGALDYGELNSEYVGLIQEAKDAGVNLGLLQGMTDKWVAKYDASSGKMKNYNTGEPVPDGMKKVADHVDITLNHYWDGTKREYIVKTVKFPNKIEKDKETPNLSFGEMAVSAFPESDVANWI